MIGLGTLINCAGILLGGVIGFLFGKRMPERVRGGLNTACGITVLFIGISGAMEQMLLVGGKSMFVVVCVALGTLVGELINIEGLFERFGEWLKVKTGNAKDKEFVNAFVTASLTVCIGAMAIVGAIQDGLTGDFSILATKAVLDLIIIIVMTCSMGKGCVFSALPVLVLEGAVTLLAKLISPVVTEAAQNNISLVGSILIFCVGVNLVWGKRVRVANMLPSVFVAAGAAFLPFSF
ncbi:MAG: DUF554 domain-containing protein [Lachnospiraceae bacterium]|nr:DUF554 domain-containing protein [Ruminococcus sp.]MCM1274569.1 DUF554 domain-containing protein [Lachnospiraceae bacterium]